MKQENSSKRKRNYIKDQLKFAVRFIAKLAHWEVFTTRELLPLVPKRAPLDVFLSKQVASGYLERLARGVFRRRHKFNRVLTEEAIAGIKRQSFAGRCLTTTESRDSLQIEKRAFIDQLELANERNPLYLSQGTKSNFKIEQLVQANKNRTWSFRESRVDMKAVGNRKAKLGESQAGQCFREIWRQGIKKCTDEIVENAYFSLSKSAREELLSLKQYLPQWISDRIPSNDNLTLSLLVNKRELRKKGSIKQYCKPGSRIFA